MQLAETVFERLGFCRKVRVSMSESGTSVVWYTSVGLWWRTLVFNNDCCRLVMTGEGPFVFRVQEGRVKVVVSTLVSYCWIYRRCW